MSFLTSATDVAIEEDLKQFLIVLLVAVTAASLPKIFAPLRQVPYTLLLLVVGLGLALVDVRLLHLSPGLILMVFLPPLLFEAAWNLRWSELKQEFLPSSLYAVGGVVISIAGVGWALHQFVGIPWMTSLLVGGCLSATDSAAVLGIFREVGASKRLTTLLEGEALLNDGAAVVAFGVLVELAVSPQSFDLATTIVRFFVVTGIGLGVGGTIGLCFAVLTQRYELDWVEQSLTLVAAYGSYLLVEELGGSGVFGVVATGLVIGNFSTQPGVLPHKRSSLVDFWEFVTFLVNSILFLLLGDQIHLPKLLQHIETTAVAVVAIVGTRALTIYGFTALTNWLARTNISWQNQTILWWTGLRGSVSISLAIGLPLSICGRDEIIANSFGVVWFTLLVQGLTTKPLLAKLNLLEDRSLQQQYLELLARRDALQQVCAHLNRDTPPTIDLQLHRSHQIFVQQQLQQLEADIEHLRESHSCLQALSLERHQAELLAIEVNTYKNLVRDGSIEHPLKPIIQKVFE
ncbi:cation:proton antiporter [Chamaesiphon polymorphus]|uniref:Sodium:proton antiporter n=1 Tax=Chamaesiphon polymorphus CCALA 037 TaxID=2107692 RepID=A0A2T1GGD3_9CYAN|nr:sodium:proton antiporter [Chamaesiphon polymorphus]PSB56708.1 sodium:proton antiporter [Chamaesiphon polymorphus CCALA 037]